MDTSAAGSAETGSTPVLSVVIPTYDRRDSLLRTLAALGRQTYDAGAFEALVVSDGSTDGTREALVGWSASYRFRFLEQRNGGPGAARNLGASSACGEIVVFLDDDVEPVREFLAVHAEAHAADASLVLIGPQSKPPGERCPVWVAWEHQMLERQYARFCSGEWEAGPNNLYSGNFSVRRRHLLDCGGFDERYRRQEDVELGFRLHALGLRFRFEPRANGLHRPGRTYKSWYDTPFLYGKRDVEMHRDKGEGAAMELARKHYRERNWLTRVLARSLVGRGIGERVLFAVLRPAIPAMDRWRMHRLGLLVCSLTFNLRYLQGMAREMGGARTMWRSLASADKTWQCRA